MKKRSQVCIDKPHLTLAWLGGGRGGGGDGVHDSTCITIRLIKQLGSKLMTFFSSQNSLPFFKAESGKIMLDPLYSVTNGSRRFMHEQSCELSIPLGNSIIYHCSHGRTHILCKEWPSDYSFVGGTFSLPYLKAST